MSKFELIFLIEGNFVRIIAYLRLNYLVVYATYGEHLFIYFFEDVTRSIFINLWIFVLIKILFILEIENTLMYYLNLYQGGIKVKSGSL